MDPGQRKTEAHQVQGVGVSTLNQRLYSVSLLQGKEQEGLNPLPCQRRGHFADSAAHGVDSFEAQSKHHLHGVPWLRYLPGLWLDIVRQQQDLTKGAADSQGRRDSLQIREGLMQGRRDRHSGEWSVYWLRTSLSHRRDVQPSLFDVDQPNKVGQGRRETEVRPNCRSADWRKIQQFRSGWQSAVSVSNLPWHQRLDGAVLALDWDVASGLQKVPGSHVPARRHGAQQVRLHRRLDKANAILPEAPRDKFKTYKNPTESPRHQTEKELGIHRQESEKLRQNVRHLKLFTVLQQLLGQIYASVASADSKWPIRRRRAPDSKVWERDVKGVYGLQWNCEPLQQKLSQPLRNHKRAKVWISCTKVVASKLQKYNIKEQKRQLRHTANSFEGST